jgi:hypothetical protein
MASEKQQPEGQEYLDPITGEPASHPIGTGIGAAVGGVALGAAGMAVATGTALGAAAGPLGAAVGAVAGGIAGGLVGHQVAESIYPIVPEVEDEGESAWPGESYWHGRFADRPYAASGRPFADYLMAYRFGWESRTNHLGQSFETVEPELRRRWEEVRGDSPLSWDEARLAVRDAWNYEAPTVRGPDVAATAEPEQKPTL